MDSSNNELYEKLHAAMEHRNPFVKEIGMKITALGEGTSETEMEILPKFLNFQHTVHGGVLYSMADTTAGLAATTAMGCVCVTLNSSISFLAPAGKIGTKLYGRAKTLRWGRRTAVCDVFLYDQDEKLCVRGTFTFCPTRWYQEDASCPVSETEPEPPMPE